MRKFKRGIMEAGAMIALALPAAGHAYSLKLAFALTGMGTCKATIDKEGNFVFASGSVDF